MFPLILTVLKRDDTPLQSLLRTVSIRGNIPRVGVQRVLGVWG